MKNGSFMTMFIAKRQWIDEDESLRPTSKVELHGRKVMYMVGPQRYYSFWVFKLQSDTHCRLIIISTAAMCSWKSSENASYSSIGETCASPIDDTRPHSTRITLEKYCIYAALSFPIYLTLLWFPSFSFSTKCFEFQKNFPRRTGENICGKVLELKTCGFLLERNQPATL